MPPIEKGECEEPIFFISWHWNFQNIFQLIRAKAKDCGFRQVKNNLIISKELHVPRPTVQIVVQVTEEFNHLTKIWKF